MSWARYTLVTQVVTLAFVTLLSSQITLVNATIVVISKNTNETVFAAEEVGIDAASAYDLKGNLVVAEPNDACSDVKPPPNMKNHTLVYTITGQRLQRRDSWILWATYNYTGDPCSLSKKAKEAEYAGYSAIVITVFGSNDTSGILPSFMGFEWMGVRIYTSILGENMGKALRNFSYPNHFYIQFQNEPYFQLGLLANFVFLGCLGILIVVILLRLFHCVYMRVSSSVQERRRKRKAFLTEAQLKKLPVLHWRTSIPQDMCSICIENFEVGDEIRVLPCSHVFHSTTCLDVWLIRSSRRCPNCKRKVIFPNENLSDSSNSDSDSHMEDSDDEFIGNERTPLLRGHASDSDDQIEDTRFIETVAESQNLPPSGREGTALRSNSLVADGTNESNRNQESACLIDISSDNEQISDDSFGSFQSAGTTEKKGTETMLVDVDCSLSMGSAKSYDSDKTFVEDNGKPVKQSGSRHISKQNDEFTSSFGSNTSFFSCLESELEKSTNSTNNNTNELFQSFSS